MADELVPCKTCGEQIAKKSGTCPKCGAAGPSAPENPVALILICVFGILAVGFIVAAAAG